MIPLVLYDGYCVLCSRVVAFLEPRQRPGALAYAGLQSPRGQATLAACGLSTTELDTFVLYEGGCCYTYSTAVLRLFRHLRFPWPLLSVFLIVPRFLRDPIYNVIAHNRFRWFGRLPRK